MRKVIFASKNKGKVEEVKALMKDYDVEVLSLIDVGYAPEIIEDGGTFTANALIKARAIFKEYGLFTIADDSGLEIEALGGKPGVDTAIYAGDIKCDELNMDKVLDELKNTPNEKRGANFKCVLVAIDEQGTEHVVEGNCGGSILKSRVGDFGHGYDPIFYVPEVMKSLAQLTTEQKNRVSHRKRAFDELKTVLDKLLS